MGKHERNWSEQAEKNVVDGLNGIEQNIYIQQVIYAIKNKIGNDFQLAKWTGGDNYDDPGDVHVHWVNKIVRIELKFSRGKGSGTAKNKGQKTFTLKVSDTIEGYQAWDDKLGLRAQRKRLLEERLGITLKSDNEYKKQLRILRNNKDPIVEKISDITAPGQESYARYAAEQCNKHLANVNSLVHEILGTTEFDTSRQDIIYCVVKNFETPDQTVDFFDFTDLDKKVVRVESSGKSIKFINSSGKDILRFSVTWKNICQGGSTPCFNIFVGNAFKN